jgi:hypothetical protein
MTEQGEEKNHNSILELARRVSKSDNYEQKAAFERYCNSFLIKVIPPEIFDQLIKILKK